MDRHEIFRCSDLDALRDGLIDAIDAGNNLLANDFAWQAGAVARANRTGRPIGSGVDLDFDAEWKLAQATIHLRKVA